MTEHSTPVLDRKDILKLAKLSRLELSDEDVEAMQGHLRGMLAHMQGLRNLDLSQVEPMTAVDEPPTTLRKDEPMDCLPREKAFQNAPHVENDHFVIPKVIG
ncbi:MAG TPA: Asp-tRNA(Asn)/Glu-tRNA(Gln) amidotransferase subunit GatC [Fibrobacteraceae bacterium]|nr:Asp-tRNA(Asn)/Glu-tRNA(Gln) amidotransferase subunit GatC [Fibrobacteraceae bacterium]